MQLVISGEESKNQADHWVQKYFPDVLLAVKEREDLPLTEGKGRGAELSFYLCVDGACSLPSDSAEETMRAIQQNRHATDSYS